MFSQWNNRMVLSQYHQVKFHYENIWQSFS